MYVKYSVYTVLIILVHSISSLFWFRLFLYKCNSKFRRIHTVQSTTKYNNYFILVHSYNTQYNLVDDSKIKVVIIILIRHVNFNSSL